MPKVKWGVSGKAVDDVDPDERGDFEPYDGPIPPKGTVLLMDVKSIEHTKFKTGSEGLKLLLICVEDKGAKKKYAGLPVWDNIVVVESAGWKIRQFCDAIGATGKDWDGTVIDSEKKVTKIGRIKMDGLQVEIVTNKGENQDGDPRAEVLRYVPLNEEGDDDSDDDNETGDDGEAPF